MRQIRDNEDNEMAASNSFVELKMVPASFTELPKRIADRGFYRPSQSQSAFDTYSNLEGWKMQKAPSMKIPAGYLTTTAFKFCGSLREA